MTTDQLVPQWLPISAQTAERLRAYAALVAKWTRAVNLIAAGSLGDLWSRHILDSAQLWPMIDPEAREWVDLGSGGGLPGMVVAVLLAETSPHSRMTFIESDKRKAAFLVQASRELGLTTRTLPQRIEDVAPLGASRMTARAVAPLSVLLSHAGRHLALDGRAYFMKGARHVEEIAQARQEWHFNCTCHTSRTEAEAAILEIDQIARL